MRDLGRQITKTREQATQGVSPHCPGCLQAVTPEGSGRRSDSQSQTDILTSSPICSAHSLPTMTPLSWSLRPKTLESSASLTPCMLSFRTSQGTGTKIHPTQPVLRLCCNHLV